MTPPDGATLIKGELATFWLDASGILYAIAKDVARTLDMQKKNYDLVKQITGNKKVCILSDTTSSMPQSKETRDYVASEIQNVFKAMAVISASPLGKFSANIFISLKEQPVPVKFFNSETEAREWLQQYL